MQYISLIKGDLDLSTQPHRYLRLPHPRTGLPQLYLTYISEGRDRILEASKISCGSRRTWFVGDSQIDTGTILAIEHEIKLIKADFYLYAFALPEAFSRATNGKTEPAKSEGMNEDIARLLALKSVRKVFRLCCERKVIPLAPPSPPENGGSGSVPKAAKQVYYRPSLERVVALLQTKVDYFSAVERFEQFDHLVRGLSRDGLLSSDGASELTEAARRKMTCDHLGQWLPAPILASLIASHDFAALSEYLANRTAATLAAQAPVVTVKKDNKADAKRKAPAGSRGVEALKKVNTASMSKLTNFFRPKEGKK